MASRMSEPPPYTASPHIVITQQPGKNGFYILHLTQINWCWLSVHTTQTVVLQSVEVGPGPSVMNCPNCLATVRTNVDFEISGRTHLCALGLCLIGFVGNFCIAFCCVRFSFHNFRFWPCILIPYFCCGGCCKRTVHTCPNCNHFIGSF